MNAPKLEAPDFFGYSIFCDDIRQEIDGKVTYVGVYSGAMAIRAKLPIVLPKFCIGIVFAQRRPLFTPDIGIRIFVPGDSDEKASIEAQFSGPFELPEEKTAEATMVRMTANVVFSPFPINNAGAIKVRILRNDLLHRLGTLSVEEVAEQAPT
jgi:hypothetical protein